MSVTSPTPMERTTPQDLGPTGLAILQAALGLFRERGFHGTSIREIAGLVGVQPGAVYNHFDGKQDILFEIIDSGITDLYNASQIEMAAAESPDQRLRAFVRCHTRFHGNNPEQTLVIDRDLTALSEENLGTITTKRRAYEDLLVGVLEVGASTGDFRPLDPRITAYALIGMGTEVAVWFRPDGRLDLTEIEEMYADFASVVAVTHAA